MVEGKGIITICNLLRSTRNKGRGIIDTSKLVLLHLVVTEVNIFQLYDKILIAGSLKPCQRFGTKIILGTQTKN